METETGVHEPVNREARGALERAETQQAMLRIANPEDRGRTASRRELPQPCRSCARTGARGNGPKNRDSA
jgi:hypothetical protein